MSYDISYEEKNEKLHVKCNKELYSDIIKKFGGKWYNKTEKFIVPLESKDDIDSLIANVKALQTDDSKEEDKENDMDTPFKPQNESEESNTVVFQSEKEFEVDDTKKEDESNTAVFQSEKEPEPIFETESIKPKKKKKEVESNTAIFQSEKEHEPIFETESIKPKKKKKEVESNTAENEKEPENNKTTKPRKKKKEVESNTVFESEPVFETKTEIGETNTETNTESKTESEQPINFYTKQFNNSYKNLSVEEVDILDVNRSDIESEDEIIPIPKFQKSSKIKQQNKIIQNEFPKQPQKNKVGSIVVKQQSELPKSQNYKSRFETDSVDYNQYNSDDEDIYEDEEGEEESESGEESGESEEESGESEEDRSSYSSETDSYFKKKRKNRTDSDSESDYKKSNSKLIQKRKNRTDSETETDYKKSNSKSSRNKEYDYTSSKKHYTKEEKEKLKRKIEMLEMKKAKKLGKPIDDIRAERKETSVRFNQLVKKVENLEEQVEDLKYQVRRLYRR